MFIGPPIMLADLILFIVFWLYSAAFSPPLHRIGYVLVFALMIPLFRLVERRSDFIGTPLAKFFIDRNVQKRLERQRNERSPNG